MIAPTRDANNWHVGIHYLQTLPKALLFEGIEDSILLQAYNESLEAFKLSIPFKKTTHGDYEIITEKGKLYSRNADRLKMLAHETLLKLWTIQTQNISEAITMINDGSRLPKKEFGGTK